MSGKAIDLREFMRLLDQLDREDLGFMFKFTRALRNRDPRDELLLQRLRRIERSAFATRAAWRAELLRVAQRQPKRQTKSARMAVD
jgi:hypothetical protein